MVGSPGKGVEKGAGKGVEKGASKGAREIAHRKSEPKESPRTSVRGLKLHSTREESAPACIQFRFYGMLG
jgi:hypothetical protein